MRRKPIPTSSIMQPDGRINFGLGLRFCSATHNTLNLHQLTVASLPDGDVVTVGHNGSSFTFHWKGYTVRGELLDLHDGLVAWKNAICAQLERSQYQDATEE